MTASQGQALENAILANPDDLGAHAAYADWLIEQGDPRGEFIQVQLALEDPKRAGPERKQLQEHEQALLKAHARTWLGDLGRFLVGSWSGAGKPFDYQFSRGWLDAVRLLPFPIAASAALARSPEARLLRQLEITYDMRYHPFDFEPFTEGPNQALTEKEQEAEIDFNEGEGWDSSWPASVFGSPYLTSLRVFKIGFSDTGDRIGHTTMVPVFLGYQAQAVVELLRKCPRLEGLYLNASFAGIERLFASPELGSIRVLQYYFGSDYNSNAGTGGAYPLTALANNASLKRLTHLRLHPGRDATIDLNEMDAILRSSHLPALTHLQVHMTTFGDEGCRRIVESGILGRLKVLDIGYGNMTDKGALILARCPDLKNLDVLDVSRNSLTEQSVAALQAVGIQVIAGDQHAVDDEAYLYEVDLE